MSMELVIDYGNLGDSASFSASTNGAAVFENGLNTMSDDLDANGSYAFTLYPEPGQPPGTAFTLHANLGSVNLQRNGKIGMKRLRLRSGKRSFNLYIDTSRFAGLSFKFMNGTNRQTLNPTGQEAKVDVEWKHSKQSPNPSTADDCSRR